ncbi:hypothetical protein JOF53_005452 [Crossiella equi]|uniref:DUF5666 domain-containing protein n=1 Tax=Crossiella equi TaxID=130796 RepID=A0ABS5AJ24_9PSEU|nr:DUF5666 domain-containing protein [Crossiella equi]MBP2476580.1 hypothetical protein [Crossiella equi]
MSEQPLIVPVPDEQPPARPGPPRRRGLLALGAVLVAGVAGAAVGAVLLGGLTGTEQPSGQLALAGSAGQVQEAAAPERQRPHRPGRGVPEGSTVLLGTLKSVADNAVTVTRDSGGDLTVSTDSRTRVRGQGVTALRELKPGGRVVVRVDKDGKALRVAVPKAHVTGTVTKVDGDRATVLGQSGLAVVVDVSSITDKPKVGDVVAVRGVAADAGGLLKADRVRQVPARR